MKRIIALILSLLLVLSFAACGGEEIKSESEAHTAAETSEPAEATEVTEVTEVTEAIVETTGSTETSSESEVDYEAVAAVIESTGGAMHYWNVDVLGEAFFITFAYNGMSDAVEMFKDAGYDENYSEWISVKETMLALYQSNVDLMKVLGVENPMCFFSLVNENNHGETFVTIYKGEVTTDIMESD